MLEEQGIIVNSEFKIEKALKERGAFDEKSAADAEKADVNYEGVLELMEKNGLIAKTSEGKVYLTEKGKTHQPRSTRQGIVRRFIRFSRNK
ncbi:MAG: hypothetical protein NWE93_07365 [Candidatus Bathyarchaeota archaeon]|nr:hypothetical protein [Candidatus Bathyarchaeota archaeon]